MDLIIFLIIGFVAGLIANSIMKRGRSGIISTTLLGVAGSLVGGFLLTAIGLFPYGLLGGTIAAVLGSVVVLYVVSLFNGSNGRVRY